MAYVIEQDKVRIVTGELQQQGRRRLRKRHLKSEFAPISSRLILRMLPNLFEADSKGLYQSSAKEKESCCLVFQSPTNREIRHFHVLVVQ